MLYSKLALLLLPSKLAVLPVAWLQTPRYINARTPLSEVPFTLDNSFMSGRQDKHCMVTTSIAELSSLLVLDIGRAYQ